MLLDAGFDLSLRPMKYPKFYDAFIAAMDNNWSVQEISFSTDIADLRDKITEGERHIVHRLVAFFAASDIEIGNNAVINLYRHVNSPEARCYYSRQIFEEALHVQFYLTLLDNYIPDFEERAKMFDAINSIPSVKKKSDWMLKWFDEMKDVPSLETDEQRRRFLLSMLAFAVAIEGMFFFAAFAYVYYLRDRGLLHGLASGTNWVFRDESWHMNFAFMVVDQIRAEMPHLWDSELENQIREMIIEAIDCEMEFAKDVLSVGVMGLSVGDMNQYLQYVSDKHLERLGMEKMFNVQCPFEFMLKQDVASLTSFFERTTTDYISSVGGDVAFNEDF